MDMSGLSHWDYVNLVGHYHKLGAGDLIDPQIYERGYTEAQIKVMEETAKKQQSFDETRTLDLLFTGHLNEYNYNHFSYVVTLYQQYKTGMLPFPGSLSEQPAQIIDIMNILTQIEFEVDKRERLKAKQEQQQLNNRPR